MAALAGRRLLCTISFHLPSYPLRQDVGSPGYIRGNGTQKKSKEPRFP